MQHWAELGNGGPCGQAGGAGTQILAGARKLLGRVDILLQQTFLQLGQDAQLQTEMAIVMGRMQALKESVELVAERVEAQFPQEPIAQS